MESLIRKHRQHHFPKINGKDKYDVPTNFFIGRSQDGSAGEARKLKNRIEAYKKGMVSLLDPKYQTTMKLGLKTEGKFTDSHGVSQNWKCITFTIQFLLPP